MGCASICFCCARACGGLRAFLRSAHAGVHLVGIPGRGRAEGSGLLVGLGLDAPREKQLAGQGCMVCNNDLRAYQEAFLGVLPGLML